MNRHLRKNRDRSRTDCYMTGQHFKEKLAEAENPVVVDVWAPWCRPCRVLSPLLEETSEKYKGRVDLWKVNADEEQEVGAALGVKAIPTVIVFNGEEEIARAKGVQSRTVVERRFEIGLGDEDHGSRIPITGPNGEKTFLKYNGQEVWSKVDGDMLREVVYATDGGKYLSVEPGTTLDLDKIYESLIASAQKRELESTTMLKYDERFQIFVALGLVMIICEVFVSERRKI